MEQPDGFSKSEFAEAVCRLLHALYGLKQAYKMLHAKMDDLLVIKMGFEQVNGDPCFYSRQVVGQVVIIMIYVDVLLIAASCICALNEIKTGLGTRFDMKDRGEARVILGLELLRDRESGTRILTTSIHAAQVLEGFNIVA